MLGLIGWALGIDPRLLIGGAEILTGDQPQLPAALSAAARTPRAAPARRPTRPGASSPRVLGSTEVQWKDIFAKEGQTYRAPRLVMFSGATRSACGAAQSAMGPFYCPNDREVYLDTSFFRDLERRFRGCSGKACEFAQAYVIAHEVGHHVQNLLGILPKVQQAQRAAGNRVEANHMQVRVELQADCFAGVWAQSRRAEVEVPRSRRHRGGAADRVRHRRRHAAAPRAGLRRARQLHPRLVRAAQALVHRPASRKAR